MEFLRSSNTEPNMGYLITHGLTVLDLVLDEEVMGYGLTFWLNIFKYITDDMYINPLPRRVVKRFYTQLVSVDGDFTVPINDKRSLRRVGNKVHYVYS
jgi:hypothetical protein